ncbi:MAG: hypothetical protein PHW00_03195 [Clostridia bacterium]|nr:hypothetical protein [Clostridia bacterium]
MVRSFFCSKCGKENKNVVVEDDKAEFVCDECGFAHEIIFNDNLEFTSEELAELQKLNSVANA